MHNCVIFIHNVFFTTPVVPYIPLCLHANHCWVTCDITWEVCIKAQTSIMTTDGGRNEPERYLSTFLSLKTQWCIFKPELLCIAFIGDIMEKLPENFVMGPSVCDHSVFAANHGRWVTVMNELCVWVVCVCICKTGCEIHEIFFSKSLSPFLSLSQWLCHLCGF